MRGSADAPRAEVFTVDGFYPTGDLGRLDVDGYLFFTGRRDDMFKVRGRDRVPERGRAALHAVAGVRRAYVVDLEGDGGAAGRSAVVVLAGDGRDAHVDDLARDAKPAQRVQGADPLAHRSARRRAHDHDRQGRQGRPAAPVLTEEPTHDPDRDLFIHEFIDINGMHQWEYMEHTLQQSGDEKVDFELLGTW